MIYKKGQNYFFLIFHMKKYVLLIIIYKYKFLFAINS